MRKSFAGIIVVLLVVGIVSCAPTPAETETSASDEEVAIPVNQEVPTWEKISDDETPGHSSSRLWVYGGWLVRSTYHTLGSDTVLIFVKDHFHEWK